MIDVKNLIKWYGPTLAVDGISFHIPAGQVVGFLGPNGAGKSTTLRMVTGYLPPSSGSATVAGQNVLTAPEAARAKVGYLPESTPLYLEMRVEEYLDYRGKLFQMDRSARRGRINLVCDRCGLSAIRGRVIGRLSRGNRQRVGLAQALLHDPPVLVLDEPTAGLDPNQISQFRQFISELRGRHTIILSTHILPEVEKSADRVVIIAGGRIVAEGTPDELRRTVAAGSRVLIEIRADEKGVVEAFRGIEGVKAIDTKHGDGWCMAAVTPRDDRDLREALAGAASSRGWAVREIRHEVASLEQFFVQITASQGAAARSA